MEDEYDPNDGRNSSFDVHQQFLSFFSSIVNNRPRIIDDRLKQLQPHQNKSSKPTTIKTGNDDLKKLIQERRKAAATAAANQNHDVEIFVTQK